MDLSLASPTLLANSVRSCRCRRQSPAPNPAGEGRREGRRSLAGPTQQQPGGHVTRVQCHTPHTGVHKRERERGFLMFRISWASALITISDSFGLLLPCHVWYSSPEHASMAASFQVQRSLSPLPLDTRLSMPTFGFVGACKMPCLRQIYLR